MKKSSLITSVGLAGLLLAGSVAAADEPYRQDAQDFRDARRDQRHGRFDERSGDRRFGGDRDDRRFPIAAPPVAPVERFGSLRGYLWIPGEYEWLNHEYVFVPGHYANVRRGERWAPGHWVRRGRAFVKIPGRWERY